MKKIQNGALPLVEAVLFLLVTLESAHAGLLTDVNMGALLYEDDALSGASQSITDSAVPFQESVTVGGPYGTGYYGSITGNYSITDNGSVATFGISCSGSLTTNGNSVTEHSNEMGATFDLTQPYTFTAAFKCAGSGQLNYDIPGILQGGSISNSTRTYSGEMNAGPFVLTEGWVISNTGGIPMNQSGTDSISITFYATEPIPEPSSAMLIGLSAVAMLGRRRRPPASPSRREGDRNSVASGQAL